MKQNKKIKLKKGDIFIITAFSLLCAVLFMISRQPGKAYAEVTVNGEKVYEVALADIRKPTIIPLDNGVVITAQPGAIFFSDSPCAGHDCVKTGKLTRPGQIAVCLPMKTVIKITGIHEKTMPDAIT